MPSGLHRCKIVRLVLGVCSQSFACLHDFVYCLILRSVCQVPSFMIALSLLHSILLTEEKTAWLTRTLTLTHPLARWTLTTTCGEVRAKKNVLRMFFYKLLSQKWSLGSSDPSWPWEHSGKVIIGRGRVSRRDLDHKAKFYQILLNLNSYDSLL